MTRDFVADSSVGASWAVRSQATEVTDRLAQQAENGATFYVPPLWFFEVSNVLVTLVRRGKLTPDDYQRGRRQLEGVKCRVDAFAQQRAMTVTGDLAQQLNLSAYDAAYLEIAQRLGLPMATRDGRLLAAAVDLGLQTIDAR